MKIAMWSGPRNLSTAMMYSFGNRTDCAVTDEPFYAAYLAATGVVHPMQQEILDSQDNDAGDVALSLVAANPNGNPIWYQKHMTHHMIDGFPLEWISEVTNVFLIRHPARVIASYAAKRENPTLDDLGFVQQKMIYDRCVVLGQNPVVIDSDDILADPKGSLTALCEEIGIPFDPAMLSWTAGARAEDGVWAAHWYDSVHKSTGFGSGPARKPYMSGPIYEAAMKIYKELRPLR